MSSSPHLLCTRSFPRGTVPVARASGNRRRAPRATLATRTQFRFPDVDARHLPHPTSAASLSIRSHTPRYARTRVSASTPSFSSIPSSSASPLSPPSVLRIVLMRHAESLPAGQSNTSDHERAVTPQGASKVRSIASQLKSKGFVPNLFLSSNSARSKQTYGAMMETMPELEVADAHFFGSLYTESQMDGHTLPHLMELIRSLGDVTKHTCVLCLGHNKGWEEAASALAGEKVVLKNGDAALFEMALDEVKEWKDAMSRVGQKSGWRFSALLTE